MAASSKPKSAQPAKPAKRRFFNYPRRHIRSFRRWLPSWRFILGAFLSVIALGAGFLVAAFVTTDVPTTPLADTQQQTTSVYYADGTTLMGTFYKQNRTDVDIKDLPKYVPEAIVASEDKTFYQNSGVDIRSQIRAFLNNVKGGGRQGGSTITEQYIERYYVGDTTTYLGKLQEAIRAVKVRQNTSADEILQEYMNTIYFGRGAYGIQAASQAYFGKDAKDLTVSEAALLAGVIPSPTNYDPAVNKDLATARWNHALDGMVDNGYISATDRSKLVFPATINYQLPDAFVGTQGYLMQMVVDELTSGKNAPFTENQLYTGGYKIVTTFDKKDQDALVQSVNNLPDDKPDSVKVASASIDTTTGAVRAVYGGTDPSRLQNSATQDITQAGSTFKIFTLAAALEDGIPLDQKYSGSSPREFNNNGDPWSLQNEGNQSYGYLTMTDALTYSVNTIFAQINQEVGPEATVNAAIRAGLPKDTQGLTANLANVLGTASPHPIDVADAYATFANGGTYHPWYSVTSVTDPSGKVLYKGQKAGTKEFDTDIATNVTYAMQQVVNSGTAQTVQRLGRPAAGKTGTTDNHQSIWFTGYTPQLATTVAMYQVDGKGNPSPRMDLWGGKSQMNGGDFPAQVWTDYMKVATADMPVEDFPPEVTTGFKAPTGGPTPSATAKPAPTQQVPQPTPTQAPQPTTPVVTPPPVTPTQDSGGGGGTPTPTPDSGGGTSGGSSNSGANANQNSPNRNPNSGGGSSGG